MPKCNSNVAVTFRHSCLLVFAWRRVVLHFFDPKQLLRVASFLWCYFQSVFLPCYLKCSSHNLTHSPQYIKFLSVAISRKLCCLLEKGKAFIQNLIYVFSYSIWLVSCRWNVKQVPWSFSSYAQCVKKKIIKQNLHFLI